MHETWNVGDGVFVRSKNERGVVVEVKSETLVVRLLLALIEVQQGDCEKR